MRRVGLEERRARLGIRHRLAASARTDDVVEVTRSVVALHATDPASVFLAAAARLRDPDVTAIEAALYAQRSLVRLLGMRRTMFVVPLDLVPVIELGCTRAIAERQRRKLVRMVEDFGVAPDGAAWLDPVETATLAALDARGQAVGPELSEDVPELRTEFSYGEGKAWAGTMTLTTPLLNLLSAEGKIVRGRPRGSWVSSQYRWASRASWRPDVDTSGDEALLADPTPEGAQLVLVRQWLRAFGPGTVADIKWWTGLSMGQVRRALAAIEPVEVDLDGTPGLMLADDPSPDRAWDRSTASEPWVALLPPLDPTPMGWAERDWFLGEHRSALFDRSGNIGPTVWCCGRVVGGWAQRRGGDDDGVIVYRLFEDIGREMTAAVESAAERLATWYGAVRATPRFRTPLERELTA